jgi:cytochrome P450/NADPH-cytochrome P450 reductase
MRQRQWRARQAVPQRLMPRSSRRRDPHQERGETDAGGDFFGAFDEWYGALWNDLGRALKEVHSDRRAAQVEVVKAGRTSILWLGDLEPGEVVENRSWSTWPAARTVEAPHRHHAAGGHGGRAGDYLAVCRLPTGRMRT